MAKQQQPHGVWLQHAKRLHSYGRSQGICPSFPMPPPLQAAAMRRTGFFCTLSPLIVVFLALALPDVRSKKKQGNKLLQRALLSPEPSTLYSDSIRGNRRPPTAPRTGRRSGLTSTVRRDPLTRSHTSLNAGKDKPFSAVLLLDLESFQITLATF